MRTYRELVFAVLDETHTFSDDTPLENEHVISLLQKYRTLLFNQKYKGKKVEIPFAWYQRLNVNFTYPSIGSNIYKSTKQIPPVLDTTNLWQYTFISTDGANAPNLNFINPQRFKTCGYNKWTSNELYGTIDLDNYMYLKSKNDKYIDISQSDIKIPVVGANTTLHPRWNDSISPIIYGTDKFKFNALPSGTRTPNGEYNNIGFYSYLYTSDNNLNDSSNVFLLYNYSSTIINYPTVKNFGYSIRLVRPATNVEQLLPDGTIIPNSYIDFDENIYTGTKIGLQIWTTTPLKVTHYIDGTLIPNDLSNSAWASDTNGACATYGKSDGDFVSTDELTTELLMVDAYGRLYNWYSINNASGLVNKESLWDIPSTSDFTQLIDYVIDTYSEITTNNIGTSLKSIRQINSAYSTFYDEINGSILYDVILDNPIDADRFNGTNTLDVLDLEFPCEESLIQPIIDLCLKEIGAINNITRDITNNASDDASLPKQQ